MTRFQYLTLVIALFLLTTVFLFPPRRYSNFDSKMPSRGFLFENLYVEVQEFRTPEGREAFSKSVDTFTDYPRMDLELLALGSATAFFLLLFRPRRYAD